MTIRDGRIIVANVERILSVQRTDIGSSGLYSLTITYDTAEIFYDYTDQSERDDMFEQIWVVLVDVL